MRELQMKSLWNLVWAGALLFMHGCGGSGGDQAGVLAGVSDESLSETVHLTAADVQTIIAQAATQASASAHASGIALEESGRSATTCARSTMGRLCRR